MTRVAYAHHTEDLFDGKGRGLDQVRRIAKLEVTQILSRAYSSLAAEEVMEMRIREAHILGQFTNRQLAVRTVMHQIQGSFDPGVQRLLGLGFQRWEPPFL